MEHANPHGTAHGAVIFAVGGTALAAAANDALHSGVVGSVHVDYLTSGRIGDTLVARAEVAERLPREDVFVVRVVRGTSGADMDDVVARMTARATRRARAAAGPEGRSGGQQRAWGA